MKKTVITFSVVLVFLTLQFPNYAQQVEEAKSNITTEKMRLLILPATIDSSEPYLLENEITNEVVKIATNLCRFDVLDRNNLDKNLLQEFSLQDGMVNTFLAKKFGQRSDASDVLIVSIVNFSQVDIPEPEEEPDNNKSCASGCMGMLITSFFELLFTGEVSSENVETLLAIEIRKIDVETGKITENILLNADHTGGSWEKSRKQAIKKLNNKIILALKNMYPLSSEVTSVKTDEVQLILGTDIGVSKGTIFEIVNPAGIKTTKNKQVTIPEHRAGLVSVSGEQGEIKSTKILRQWLPFKPEYRAIEYTKRNRALQIEAVTPFSDDYWSIGIQYHANALKTFDWGGGLRYIRITDSYGHGNSGFSTGGFGYYRFINNPKLDFSLKVGFDIDIIFRDDDINHNVSTGIFSMLVGLCTEILLSAKSDFVIDAGYRIGGKTSKWTYSSEGNSHPAVWNENPPEVDISGFYFSVGFRLLLF